MWIVAGVLCMVSAGLSADLVDTFDTPLPAATITNSNLPAPTVTSGGPSGDFLRLVNDGVGSQRNHYSYDQTDAGLWSTIVAKFDFAGSSPDTPADGFSFSLLNTATYGTSGAGPNISESANAAGVLGLGFFCYPSNNPNTVLLSYDNKEIARYSVDSSKVNFTNGVWNQAQWTINNVGPGSFQQLKLIGDVNGTPQEVTVFDRWVFGPSAFDNRVQFSGRTGGLNMNVDLDNVSVAYSNPATPLTSYTAQPNTLYQDFDSTNSTRFELIQNNSTSPGPQILTTGGIDGNYLRLIQQTGNQNNEIAFDRVATGQFGRINAEWDMKVLSGADGAGFVLYNTGWNGISGSVPSIGDWENPLASGAFGIGFDVYPNIYQISLNWDGTQVAKVTPTFDFRNNWSTAKAVIEYVSGGANVTLDLIDSSAVTHNVFTDYFIAGMVPYESRVVFGGRTGGANTNFDLDHIQVQWLDQIAQPTAAFHWRGITGDYGTNTLWTNNVLPTGSDNAVIDVGVATANNLNIEGTGSLTIAGNGGLNSSGTMRIGLTGVGTVNQSGGELRGVVLHLGESAGSHGYYNLSGGELNLSSYLIIGTTGSGTFTQTGGAVTAANAIILGDVAGSTGNLYDLQGGTINGPRLSVADKANSSAAFRASGGTAVFNGTGVFGNASGAVAIGEFSGNANVTFTGDMYFGNAGSTGSGTIDDDAVITVNGQHTVIGRSGVGTFVQGGNSTVNLRRLFVAEGAGSGGSSYTLNSGTLNATDTTNIGRTHQGTFIQTGGTFNSRELFIRNQQDVLTSGDPAATATYQMTGGTLNVNSDHLVIGRGGQGHFIQDGDSTVNARRVFLAEFGGSDGSTYTLMDGTLNSSLRIEVARSAAATFTQTGGTVNAMNVEDGFSLLVGRDVAGTYNLLGGTLNARTIRKRADSTFNFSGGRLQVDTVDFDLTNTSGTLAPGHSVGTTTVNGGYTQLAGGTLEMELTTGGNDLLVVDGEVKLDGELLLLAGYDVPENTRILLINNISSESTSGWFDDLPEGTWFGVDGVTASFAITYKGGTGNDVELTAVPEPATMGLLALAAGALGGYIRRRRR